MYVKERRVWNKDQEAAQYYETIQSFWGAVVKTKFQEDALWKKVLYAMLKKSLGQKGQLLNDTKS